MNTPTSINHNARMIIVCAWCHPGETLYKHYPHLKDLGYALSHGICKECQAKLLATPCEHLRPLSYFIQKYGPDFLRKLPLYASAKLGESHVEMKDVNVSLLRAVVKRVGGEIVSCDVRELDNFVL